MKKKVAVFANGWGSDYLQEIVDGIYQKAKKLNIDIFVFVNYSTFVEIDYNNKGEINIFRLPDLSDFDGVILMANSFNRREEIEYMIQTLEKNPVPVVSIEYELDGIDCIGTDNYAGMYELAEHIIYMHDAKNIVFIGGPKEHQESNIRLKAVRDVANKYGVVIKDDDIIYSDWAKNMTQDLFRAWLDKNEALPDAIICANDIMAMGVCELLNELGYKVPKDVKVTGYDCIRLAQEFEPPITTVTHKWTEMGDWALRCLWDKIEGKEDNSSISLKTAFVCGGSCGCKIKNSRFEYNSVARNYHAKRLDALRADSHFRHIYLSLRNVESIDTFSNSLAYRFKVDSWMEGNNFMLCLEPQFFHIEENDENLRVEGYSDNMEVICSLKDGVPREYEVMKRKDAIFRVSNEKEDPGIYIFVPVHTEGKNLGFAMLTREIDIAEDNYLYIWTRHMNQYMEQVRRNFKLAEATRKLAELSITDVLTGVYNRAGCDRVIYPFLKDCQAQGGKGIVMLVDIDRMKTINDVYGHANGDLALRVVSSILKEELPKGFLVARFGGDEFFVAGKGGRNIRIESIIKRISKQLALEVKRRKIEFDLSVSIGGIQMEKGEEFVLEKCLAKVDEYMYETKKKHHAQMDGIILEEE